MSRCRKCDITSMEVHRLHYLGGKPTYCNHEWVSDTEPQPRLLVREALEAVRNYFWGTETPVLSEGEVQALVEAALKEIDASQ